jgi:hypothetical protein
VKQLALISAPRPCQNEFASAQAGLRGAGERFGQTAEIETVRLPHMEVKSIQPRQVAATEGYP